MTTDRDRIYKQVGALISSRRRDQGLTQSELGAKTSLSRGSVANIRPLQPGVSMKKKRGRPHTQRPPLPRWKMMRVRPKWHRRIKREAKREGVKEYEFLDRMIEVVLEAHRQVTDADQR